MGGNPDGSREKVKMDRSGMWVAIGNRESKESGMDAQTYLASSPQKLLIPLKGDDYNFGAYILDANWKYTLPSAAPFVSIYLI